MILKMHILLANLLCISFSFIFLVGHFNIKEDKGDRNKRLMESGDNVNLIQEAKCAS